MSSVVLAGGQVRYGRSTRTDSMRNVPDSFAAEGKRFIVVYTGHRSSVRPTCVSLDVEIKKTTDTYKSG